MYSDTAHIGLLGPVLGFILLYTLFIYFFLSLHPVPFVAPFEVLIILFRLFVCTQWPSVIFRQYGCVREYTLEYMYVH